MFTKFLLLSIKKPFYRYGLLSLIATLSFSTVNVIKVNAIPWQQLLMQGVQIMQISSISDQQEVQIGGQIHQELIGTGRVRLYNNRQANQYLNYIGNKLIKVSDRRNIPYTFSIVESDEINAFATMGGFVYINSGLMKLAENEAELASVIAHEIAHVTARHSIKQMKEQAIKQGLLNAAGLDQTQIIQLGMALALDLPHSRQDEYEADKLGLQSLTKAGYAPGAMVNFMAKLQSQGSNVPSILSTHPAAGERVQALAKAIPQDQAYIGDGLDNQNYRNILNHIF